jgi:hypothetical protein
MRRHQASAITNVKSEPNLRSEERMLSDDDRGERQRGLSDAGASTCDDAGGCPVATREILADGADTCAPLVADAHNRVATAAIHERMHLRFALLHIR